MKKINKQVLTLGLVTCLIGGSLSFARATEVASVPAAFNISGSGWGHGLGLSQYGAQGMALDGKSSIEILTHYFQGSAVENRSTGDIKVGLVTGKRFISLRGEDNPAVTGTGGALKIEVSGGITIDSVANEVVSLDVGPGTIAIRTSKNQVATGTAAVITWNNATTLLNLASRTTKEMADDGLDGVCSLASCSHRYKYGNLKVDSGNAVNTLRLTDQYLFGLGEMPSLWEHAALQSQVISARSFALKRAGTIKSSCGCNISNTTGDQVFVGFEKEFKAAGARWVNAVNATRTSTESGQVLTYRDPKTKSVSVIDAYYSSSSGGRTQNRSEVWGTGTIGWLTSVEDPWSTDPRVKNGNAIWTHRIDQATLVKNLRNKGVEIADVSSMKLGSKYASGGISRLTLTDSAGNIYNLNIAPGQLINPDGLRSVLGIKSTYISKIVPELTTVSGSKDASAWKLEKITKVNWPKSKILPSQYIFNGKVSPAQLGSAVKLQYKINGKWKTLAKTSSNSTGAWVINWTGPPPGKYSLRVTAANSKGTIKTATKYISVSGKLALNAPGSIERNKSISLSGSISPGLFGVVVTIESHIGSGKWRKTGTAITDAKGKWILETKSGSKKATISYRVKTSDARLGKVVSSTKKLKVK